MRKAIPILCTIVLSGSVRAADIQTTKERLEDGVASIARDDAKTVVTTASGKKIALEDVKEIVFSDRAPRRVQDAHFLLASGDELLGTIGDEAKPGESVKLATASLGTIEVSLDLVAAVFLDASPEDEGRIGQRRLGWLMDGKGERPSHDTFLLHSGDGGDLTGFVRKLSREGLVFEEKGGTVWPTFPLKKIELVVFGGPQPKKPEPVLRVRLHLSDGGVLSGVLRKLESGKVEIEHPLGKGTPPVLSVETKEVLALEVENGNVTYLSTLAPAKVTEKFPEGFARDQESFRWKRDHEVLGGPLRLKGKTYSRGLGVQTYSSLEFALPGAYRELRATIGLDDSIKWSGDPGQGSVTFRVLVDGEVKKEVKKKKGDAPEDISVAVANAKTVTLVADYGDYLQVLGRADWADAYLVK
jgi:hypothetical protein